VRCCKCGKDNREGRRFCSECGSALAVKFIRCGPSNAPDEKFCGNWGTALNTPPTTPASPLHSPAVTAEGRHLTVLFCDLVGSTRIAAHLDPEEWRETVAGY
jgi:hypothetical protein